MVQRVGQMGTVESPLMWKFSFHHTTVSPDSSSLTVFACCRNPLQHFPSIELWKSLSSHLQYELGILLPFILEDESARGDPEEPEASPPGLEAVVALLCNKQDTDAWHSGLENVGHSESDQEYACGETAGLAIARTEGWERMGYHLSPSRSSLLIPAQTPDQYVSTWLKNGNLGRCHMLGTPNTAQRWCT